MPEPGSKAYENQRRDLRNRYEQEGVPDKNATEAANEELQDGSPRGSAANATERVVGPAGERDATSGDPGATFPVRTAAFSDGAVIPEHFSKEGGNDVPALEVSEVPDGTAELAVVVDDLDAGGFVHWAVTGIDPQRTTIDESAGTPLRNGFGETGYDGPRPPVGETHRYRFQVFALPEPVDVSADTDVVDLRERLQAQALATGTVTGRFGR